jgi:uncharacterized protein (DUF305 family)
MKLWREKMRKLIWLVAAIGFVMSNATTATAQHHRHGHNGHATHGPSGTDTPAVREYKTAHAQMMRNMAVPFTGDPDVDFRAHMIPHHQGAVDMSTVALRHARNPSTRRVAEAISIVQPREIYEFRGWLASRATMPHRRSASAVREFKAAHAKMMRNMAMPFTGDPDVDYRMHMIPHHQGAIDMATVALRHAKDAWTRQEAEAIIIAQQAEIYQFQNWLARHGAMVPPGGRPRHIIGANSYPKKPQVEQEPGSIGELVGETWAPSSDIPVQTRR